MTSGNDELSLDAEAALDDQDGADDLATVGEAVDEMHSPPDVPLASYEYGTTGAEEAAGEPLDLRLSREVPDPALDGVLLDEGVGTDDDVLGAGGSTAGRLVEEDEGARGDETAESLGWDVGKDEGEFTMTIVDEDHAPGLATSPDSGYLDRS